MAVSVDVVVNTTTPLYTVSENFLGVTLDSALRYYDVDWFGLNFTYITPLASALGPGYLRFGGTAADRVIFQADGQQVRHLFTGQDLDTLYKFSRGSGWRLIFDFNQVLRAGDNWNSSNAKEFLDYASPKGYDMDFELGNEPDAYNYFFNLTLTGGQIADGYTDLRNLLNSYSLFKNSTIIGPSMSNAANNWNMKIIHDFLSNGGGDAVNVLTFHHYYFDGTNSTVETYLNTSIMDSFLDSVYNMTKLNYRPIGLTETAIDACSCAFNLSNTFVAGFMWLDKLGLSALNGIDHVFRQDIFGQPYGLVTSSLGASTDYWLTFLYKKLVRNKVFGITYEPNDPQLRLYAASNKNLDGFIIYGINVANYSFTLNIPQVSNNRATTYVIKEGEPGNLQSKLNQLNGILMDWQPHRPIVNLKGNGTNLPLEIPSYSQFFIQTGYSNLQACPMGWYKENIISHKCIKLVNHNTLPMFSANFDCSTYSTNASLWSVENAFENSEIAGLTAKANCSQYFIGLYQNNDTWMWANEKNGSYRNWKNGFPTSDSTKNCVIFDSITGFWANEDCDISQCYICQINV